jgi:hypothetical protein
MNRTTAYICLGAWILAAVAQLLVMLSLPDKVSAFGVDVTHASHALLVKQLLFVVFGIALASWALASTRFRWRLVVLSSLLYLLHWFPWRLATNVGLLASVKAIYQSALVPLEVVSFIRDIALPLIFVAVIAMVIAQAREVPVNPPAQ